MWQRNPYTPDTDRDDNGVNNAHPDLYGIFSGAIVLPGDTKPNRGEIELSGDTGTSPATTPR